jgi:hypothetical protein
MSWSNLGHEFGTAHDTVSCPEDSRGTASATMSGDSFHNIDFGSQVGWHF